MQVFLIIVIAEDVATAAYPISQTSLRRITSGPQVEHAAARHVQLT